MLFLLLLSCDGCMIVQVVMKVYLMQAVQPFAVNIKGRQIVTISD